jgi:Lon protease-like protein
VHELRIPIFPLPEVVFFPETVLPLHVFEPRYRQMVADCLAGHRWLAVVMLRPGWEKDYQGRPPVHPVAGAGEVIQAEALADGRYNILLDGRARVRILAEEPPDGRLYRVIRGERLGERGPSPHDRTFPGRLQELRTAHARLLVALGQSHPDVVGRLTVAGASPGAVIDRIVSAVVPDAEVRQRVLEAVDVSERLDLAVGVLSELLSMVAGREDEEDKESDEV